MNTLPTEQDLEITLLEQAATIRYVERAFLSAQLSKYTALLFTLIAFILTPLLDNIWFVVPGLIWLSIAYYRQQAAAEKLVELERENLNIQQKLTKQ